MSIDNVEILFLIAPALFMTSLLSHKNMVEADRTVHLPLHATLVSLPAAMVAAILTTQTIGIIVLCSIFVAYLGGCRIRQTGRAKRTSHTVGGDFG